MYMLCKIIMEATRSFIGDIMNYEDMDIPEYYKQKEKEHEELCSCFAVALVILITLAIIFSVAQAIKNYLGG